MHLHRRLRQRREPRHRQAEGRRDQAFRDIGNIGDLSSADMTRMLDLFVLGRGGPPPPSAVAPAAAASAEDTRTRSSSQARLYSRAARRRVAPSLR